MKKLTDMFISDKNKVYEWNNSNLNLLAQQKKSEVEDSWPKTFGLNSRWRSQQLY